MLKAASSSGAAPSFKETRDFQAEQRERERERGGPFSSWTDVRASTSALPMKWFLKGGAPPTRLIFHAVNLSA